MAEKTLSPEDVFVALQNGATKRTRDSLEIIHTICKEQVEAGRRDFSVATIGRLSSDREGPGAQAIRNTTGAHYRALLDAWASQVNGAGRKPSRKSETGVADEVLNMIPDAYVRALVGCVFAENRQLKKENTVLKMNSKVVIDRRQLAEPGRSQSAAGLQVFPPLTCLLPLEIEALRYAVLNRQECRWVQWGEELTS